MCMSDSNDSSQSAAVFSVALIYPPIISPLHLWSNFISSPMLYIHLFIPSTLLSELPYLIIRSCRRGEDPSGGTRLALFRVNCVVFESVVKHPGGDFSRWDWDGGQVTERTDSDLHLLYRWQWWNHHLFSDSVIIYFWLGHNVYPLLEGHVWSDIYYLSVNLMFCCDGNFFRDFILFNPFSGIGLFLVLSKYKP